MAKRLVTQYQASIERPYSYVFDSNTSDHIVRYTPNQRKEIFYQRLEC